MYKCGDRRKKQMRAPDCKCRWCKLATHPAFKERVDALVEKYSILVGLGF
jgi:hypothetical protein